MINNEHNHVLTESDDNTPATHLSVNNTDEATAAANSTPGKKTKKSKKNSGELTDLQKAMLEIIKKSFKETSIPPTVREICIGTGVGSTSTIHSNLRRMTELGYINYIPSTRRAITLCDKAGGGLTAKAVPVPVVGDVAAGTPILAVDNIQEYYKLPTALLRGANEDDAFILRIRGESMIDIGMFEGDYIVVDSTASVNMGEIAVVRVAGESATVKRFYKEDDKTVRLQPENSTMEPIIVPIDEVEIVGKVVALLRQY